MMIQLARSRFISAVLATVFFAGLVPLPARADAGAPTPGGGADLVAQADTTAARKQTGPGDSPAPPAAELTASLDRARALMRDGDYDGAIEILQPAITHARERISMLRDAYLLLIKSHVFLGNEFKFQGRDATSNLQYEEARRRIAECLQTRELRHVKPEPASEYPEEMVRFFAEVRNMIFGSFRVASLDPPDAVVLLDADTLRALPPDGLLGDVDIAIGPHLVVVRVKGYKDLTEEIAISPNSTLERSYRLNRKHGTAWYATVGVGALAVVGGVVALATGGGGGSTEPPPPEPLPGAPDPPSNP